MRTLKRNIILCGFLSAAFALSAFLPFQSATGTDTHEKTAGLKPNPILGLSKKPKNSETELNIWYGFHQVFGRLGMPQRWINIPGNISDPDGILSLNFTLNGGKERALSIGPDRRRLIDPGDFNIEIDRNELKIGRNQLAVKAMDRLHNGSVFKVAIDYRENHWPLPYSIDWGCITKVQDAVQVVDGLWILGRYGIRTHPDHVGYDRAVAIGDMTWKDYEVTVPVVIHAVDAAAYKSPVSIGPSFGINLHWLGHTDSPVTCSQPHCGWEPLGGSNWYKFRKDRDNGLRIITDHPATSTRIIDLQVETGKMYWFKARVETTPTGNLYRLKVWEDGSGMEPEAWTLQKQAKHTNLARGSCLLVAHHVDMSFGNVSVVPLEKSSLFGRE